MLATEGALVARSSTLSAATDVSGDEARSLPDAAALTLFVPSAISPSAATRCEVSLRMQSPAAPIRTRAIRRDTSASS
jgi:hypothetical protein